MKRRIFIAIIPPEKIQKQLSDYQKKFRHLNVRWIKQKNLHFTLLFIGWIEEEKIEIIKRTVAEDKKAREEMIKKTERMEVRYKCPSISYTYTEPTVFFEFALETMKLAKKKGLKNCWVSNGFMSKQTLDLICPYLDAINVDIKSFSEEFYQQYCKARLKPILDNLILLKKRNIWIEITTLAIPKLITEKDLIQIAKFIKKNLGKETPWHISRFFPEISWRLRHLYTTPIELVQKGCEIGMKEGLLYVYGGNVPGLASVFLYNIVDKTLQKNS